MFYGICSGVSKPTLDVSVPATSLNPRRAQLELTTVTLTLAASPVMHPQPHKEEVDHPNPHNELNLNNNHRNQETFKIQHFFWSIAGDFGSSYPIPNRKSPPHPKSDPRRGGLQQFSKLTFVNEGLDVA